jgi:hypothetical protein
MKHAGAHHKISGAVSLLRSANILSKGQSETILEKLQKKSQSTWVTIIRNTRDGSLQVWPTEDTERKPMLLFGSAKEKSRPIR